MKVSGTYQPGFQQAGIEQSQERLAPVNVLHRGSFRQLAQGTFDELQPVLCRKLPRTLQPCGLRGKLGGQLSWCGGTGHDGKRATDWSTKSPALSKKQWFAMDTKTDTKWVEIGSSEVMQIRLG